MTNFLPELAFHIYVEREFTVLSTLQRANSVLTAWLTTVNKNTTNKLPSTNQGNFKEITPHFKEIKGNFKTKIRKLWFHLWKHWCSWIINAEAIVMHNCPSAKRLISWKMDTPWQTLWVYSSETMQQIYLKLSVNVPAKVFCSEPLTNFSLHRHFKRELNPKIKFVLFERTLKITVSLVCKLHIWRRIRGMTYRRMLYIFAIIKRNHFKMYFNHFNLVSWEKHAHMITSKWFRFIIARIYNILRYVIARILRHMCNLHIKGNIIWEFGLNSWKI